MKRFTFIFVGMLFLAIGTVGAQTLLPISGGFNWSATDTSSHSWSNSNSSGGPYYNGTVTFQDGASDYNNRIGASCLGGTEWAKPFNTGETHTFTVTLEENGNDNFTLYIAALSAGITDRFTTTEPVAYASIDISSTKVLTLSVDKEYGAVYIYKIGGGYQHINIKSITRTVSGAAPIVTVNAPTITPASGTTYAGNLSVTITPGEGNDHVKYTISGSNEDKADQIISTATVVNLTGTGTITVSATGYDNANHASTTTTCEYTYSLPNGKTNVAYAIPQVVNTAMYTYTFENGDNVSTTGFSSTDNPSHDDSCHGNGNLWLKNDVKNDYSQVKDWDSQVYINLNSSDWPVGTKAILHFAMKTAKDFDAHGEKMEIAFQQNSDNNYKTCGIFSTGMVPTDKWEEYDLETTVTGDAKCEKLYFNCGKFSGEFRFDDIILYKVEEKAATDGSNEFTTAAQVANIASSAFSSLTAGDYICAGVTGTPETIKLTCNGTDYNLTQFNGSTLWGIKATADMVTALQANDSQFKGHDLTLNGINIYKTKTISQTASDNSITLVNNTFVEQNRPFAANKWNTVCLPYKPTPAQATLLFGTGYQIAGFTGVSGTTLEFTNLKSIDDFVAGRPYLLMPGEGYATSTVVLENVNITAKNPETVTYTVEDKDYSFSGTFNTKSFAQDEWSTTRFVSNNSLMTPNSTDAMKGLRCYFTVPAAATARSLSFDVDEEGGTTSINTVQGSGVMVNGYYNLAGQRVAQPTKGLYIVNGKKVVIK